MNDASQTEREATSASGSIERAQVASFGRQTAINGAVTFSVASGLALLLAQAIPGPALVAWWLVHVAVALRAAYQVVRRRRRLAGLRPAGDPRVGVRRAFVASAIAGLGWGSTALLLPGLPDALRLATMIVVAAMAGGASTTLAAVPRAAIAYVLCAILPMVVFFLWQGDTTNFGLALLALVMALAMVFASRSVYSAIRAETTAREDRSLLDDELRGAQRAWLAISRTTEAFALFDARGGLQLWNDNLLRYLSLTPADVQRGMTRDALACLASPCVEFIDDAAVSTSEAAPGVERYMAALAALPKDPSRRLVARLANGLWLRSAARRETDGTVVVIHVDVTELEQARAALDEREAELRQAQKLEAIGKLAGGVAHDFNNILTVILGYTQLLQDAQPGTATASQALGQISRAAERAASLTRQLLAFGRKQHLSPRELQLNEVLHEFTPMLSRLLPASIVLNVVPAARDSVVYADRQQLEQALLNLAVNARDALPDGGTLRFVTADADVDFVRLRVLDDGAGMDDETRERAFEPFFTTKPPGQGTGLGLASVYGFVTQSGGQIALDSALGRGTSVDILLPRASRALASDVATTAGPANGA